MPSDSRLRSLVLRATALTAASATVALAAGCGSSDGGSTGSSGGGGSKIEASTGKEIFQKAGCVSCHTLAAAGGAGNIGPNLDKAKPPREEIVEKVTNGDGRMPSFKDRLTTEQIATLADYVAEVEGQ